MFTRIVPLMINILHATDYHRRTNTGITFAINGLIEQTCPYLPSDSKIGLISIGESDLDPPAGTLTYRLPVKSQSVSPWRYVANYRSACENIIRDENMSLVHIHGVWMHSQYAAAQAASACHVPAILTNHGLLERWALRQRALKKWLYIGLMRNSFFRKITVFHAITPLNRNALHGLFPGARIELIPNAIDLAPIDALLDGEAVVTAPEPYILFVGRLASEKGIDLLIKAFETAHIPRDWKLLIVGPEETPRYSAYLRQLIAQSPRAGNIELRGPVWNPAEKYRLMRNAWLTAVPSHSEVISLVNLEASACSTPTITTSATGLVNWEQGGGLLIEASVPDLATALGHAARWSESERKDRGRASRKLVEQYYSTRVTGPRWLELYGSLSG